MEMPSNPRDLQLAVNFTTFGLVFGGFRHKNNGIYLTNIGISPRNLLGGPKKNRGFSETRHPICANVCWDIYKWGIFAKSYDIPSMGLKPTGSSGAHDTRPKNLGSKLMNAWIWSA